MGGREKREKSVCSARKKGWVRAKKKFVPREKNVSFERKMIVVRAKKTFVLRHKIFVPREKDYTRNKRFFCFSYFPQPFFYFFFPLSVSPKVFLVPPPRLSCLRFFIGSDFIFLFEAFFSFSFPLVPPSGVFPLPCPFVFLLRTRNLCAFSVSLVFSFFPFGTSLSFGRISYTGGSQESVLFCLSHFPFNPL